MSRRSDSASGESLLSPRRIALQLVGFVIGAALLAWIIHRAIQDGDWTLIRDAHPGLIAALIGCTAISALLNGTVFWITIKPIRNVGWLNMQCLNGVANMLNYAPVRLGAITRVVYHLRVDRLSILQIGAWFGLIGFVLALGIGSPLTATLLHDQFDLIWVALVVGQIVFGAIILRVMVIHPRVTRHGRGIDQMVRHPLALWGAVILRICDLAAFIARMAIAALILKIDLPMAHIAVLAIVALASSLIPFGRVGFREFCVAAVAQRLAMLASDVEMSQAQLALVESAGEALFFIPVGGVLLLWLRARWRSARHDGPSAPDAAA